MKADNQHADHSAVESRLLEQVARRDRAAFDELYLLYHSRVFRFVYTLTHSHAMTDELVNDVMLVIWEKAGSFRGDSKPSTWIFGIAYRQAIRRLSRDKSRQAVGKRMPEPTFDDNAETENWVQQGLEALPAEQHQCAILVFYLGLSYQEVAEVMNCPVNTVKTRMFHARRKLKLILPGIAEPGES